MPFREGEKNSFAEWTFTNGGLFLVGSYSGINLPDFNLVQAVLQVHNTLMGLSH